MTMGQALVELAQLLAGSPLAAWQLANRLETAQVRGDAVRGTLMIAAANAPTLPQPYKFFFDSATGYTILTTLEGSPADLEKPKPHWEGRTLSYEGSEWRFRRQRNSLILDALAGFQAASWPPFLELEDEEDRIRGCRQAIKREN